VASPGCGSGTAEMAVPDAAWDGGLQTACHGRRIGIGFPCMHAEDSLIHWLAAVLIQW